MTESRLEDGIIVGTTARCVLKGQSWAGVPTLLWPEGIDEAASDWLRAVVVEFGTAPSSAHEYANILRPFLRFCRDRRRDWRSVDDDFLIMWREHQRRVEGVGIPRVNTCLKIVFAFYRWAEETRRLQFHVGIYSPDELPPSISETRFAITAKRTFGKNRSGRIYGNWTTPLTLSAPSAGSRMRHTPTEDEIQRLHRTLFDSMHGERNSLLFSWMEEAGPRRAEVGRVGKSHLPTSGQLDDLIERDEPWLISVRRKGGNAKPFEATPHLLIRTLQYIQYERRDIVARCQAEIVGYKEPDEVFISGTTGMALHLDSVTALGRKAFRLAGIENASPHRLRARFAVRVIEELVEALSHDGAVLGSESLWFETILVKAAEKMGHAHPQSLRPYLTYVLNRRIQTAEATKVGRLAAQARQIERQVGAWVRRLHGAKELSEAGALLSAGRNAEAADALRRIADALT